MKTINLTLISITALFITSCTEEASINISGSAPGRNEINKQIESHKVETMAEIIDDDLPIIKAIGGDGKSIDWEEIEKENLEGDYGPDYFYNDCAQGIEVLQISSRLSNQGNSSYGKDQLTDDDPKTAWVEGKADYGIGESFTVKGVRLKINHNGYQSSPSNWKNNSRVKRFKIYVNNSPYA